jgi:hypothetical protein
MELGLTDVDAGDLGSATLEEAVGEAASRGPHVQRSQTRGIETEALERTFELFPTARDETGRLFDKEGGVGRQLLRGLSHEAVGAGADLAGNDQGLGEGARGNQPALHEQLVGADLGSGVTHRPAGWGASGRKASVALLPAGEEPEEITEGGHEGSDVSPGGGVEDLLGALGLLAVEEAGCYQCAVGAGGGVELHGQGD